MQLIRPNTLTAWLEATRTFLRTSEAEHGLMLGLAEGTPAPAEGVYWAYVEENGAIQAAALSTLPDRLILSRGPEEAVALLARDALHPGSRLLIGPSESVLTAAALSGRKHQSGMSQGIYELRAVSPPRPAPGRARPATSDDVRTLTAWHTAFHAEAMPQHPRPTEQEAERSVLAWLGHLFVWEDAGQPVAQAGTAGPTRGPGGGGGLRINAVYTPPELRGRGYASNLVAHVSQTVLADGYDFAFLYTDLSNLISNAIYRRLGYRHMADSREEVLGSGAT